jgi:hypothetical protein
MKTGVGVGDCFLTPSAHCAVQMDAASVKKLFGKMFIFSACFEGWM